MSKPITVTLDPGDPIAAKVLEFIAADKEAVANAPELGQAAGSCPVYAAAARRRWEAAQVLSEALQFIAPVSAAKEAAR